MSVNPAFPRMEIATGSSEHRFQLVEISCASEWTSMSSSHSYSQNDRRSANWIDRGSFDVEKIRPTCVGTLMLLDGLLKLG